jgi:predicted nucleic acid-binding protein
MRLVLDSSVVIAAVQTTEPEHDAARGFVERLRRALASGRATAFAPPELWLEVHVVERRLARSRRGAAHPGDALADLDVELVAPATRGELTAFLEHLDERMRGRRPFANATDLVYLWAAWKVEATVATLDEGLRAHHQMVCDVTHPRHLLRDA